MRNNNYLFLFTLGFFVIGIINIHFALLGIICMLTPFILLWKNKKKTWCQGYCPRANLYTKIGKQPFFPSYHTPAYLIRGNMKWIMLGYFGISLFFITMSTIAVARGFREPMNYLRFLIILPIPFELPQIFQITKLPVFLSHLSYRFYSMMLTTTILGLILGIFFKPRTWCVICPINTTSDLLLKKK